MIEQLDDIGVRLLDILQHDGRITNAELAERVGLSASACLRRVQQLEAAGLIQAYSAQLDREALGLGMEAFVHVIMRHSDRASLDEFSAQVAEWPEVIGGYMMLGEADFLLHVVTRDLASYRDFMTNRMLPHPLVQRTTTNIVLEVGKRVSTLDLSHLRRA
ncbi:MAG: Lrp/AsnC family transcriptional regulator [Pseudomonadota bacterium]|nr:Lrp/AsnC family transcriptional regulator [Pseudomonadota bacterium]